MEAAIVSRSSWIFPVMVGKRGVVAIANPISFITAHAARYLSHSAMRMKESCRVWGRPGGHVCQPCGRLVYHIMMLITVVGCDILQEAGLDSLVAMQTREIVWGNLRQVVNEQVY